MKRRLDREYVKNKLSVKDMMNTRSLKMNAGRKVAGKYIKQDLAIVAVLIGAQLFANTSGLQLRYSAVNGMPAKRPYMERMTGYGNGLGKLCATQNANAENLIKNLAVTSPAVSEGRTSVDTKAAVESPVANHKVAPVPAVSWKDVPDNTKDISVKQTETSAVDVIIADKKSADEIAVDSRNEENIITDTKISDGIPGETTDVIQKEGSDMDEPQMIELTTIGNFAVNKDGIIEKCVDPYAASVDDTIILPTDAGCTGIGAAAFDEIVKVSEVMEVYIPANITYIETEAFDKLSSLIYIEVAEGNPEYESIEGVLYDRAGNVVVYPAGREEDV